MTEHNDDQLWLFSLWRTIAGSGTKLRGHLFSRGATVEDAWRGCDVLRMSGWIGREPRFDSVHAISCTSDIIWLDAEELAEIAQRFPRDPLGARFLSARGQPLKGWRDRGLLRIVSVISVLEYRTPQPYRTPVHNDRIVWAGTSCVRLVTQGDRLPYYDGMTTTIGDRTLTLETGESLPRTHGAEDPDRAGVPRYLVSSLFTGPADLVSESGIMVGVPDEEMSEVLPVIPGVRLLRRDHARTQLMNQLKAAGNLEVLEDPDRPAFLFTAVVVAEDGEYSKLRHALARGESVDEAWYGTGKVAIELAVDRLRAQTPNATWYLEEVYAVGLDERLAEEGVDIWRGGGRTRWRKHRRTCTGTPTG